MKRIVSLILSLIMLTSSLSIFVGAENSERSSITLERTTTKNINHPVGYYVTEKRYEEMPVTFEAWVYIPKSVYSQRAGLILGNYHNVGKDDYINFEIHKNGIPRLAVGDTAGNIHDYQLTQAQIPADKWTHLTIVYGTGTDGKQVYCYINGDFKQASLVNAWYEAPVEALDNTLCLAGDTRILNEQGFRGILGDVVVYSDVRDEREVLSDSANPPDLSDENLMMYFNLSESESKTDVPDKSGNGYDMTYCRYWLTEEEMEEVRAGYEHEYEYVIAFLPDTQYMTQKYPGSLKTMFDYLVSNGKTMNIQYVIGLGDITNSNSHKEWSTVIRQTNRLNGYIPYSLVPGNHDVLLNSKYELFNQNYGKKTGYYYQHVAATGGFMDEDSVRNTYLCFSVGEIDYIIINLDFGATDDILEWAGSVLEEHPDHRAILATHGYLYADGTTLDGSDNANPPAYDKKFNSGEDMWQKLVSKYENVDMIVSGHIHHDAIVCTPREGDAGNTVYQLLMDPQSTCNKLGGMGAIGLMYFTADGNHAKVEYYSTVFERYFCESNKLISLTFGESEEEVSTEAETTLSPATDAPTEPVTEAPEPEKTGCGAILPISAAVLVVLGAPLCFKRKKED